MKFLKGLALSLLGFLLLLSLSIFATAFTLNSTILNPDFLTSELDKLDVSSLVEEITEQMPEEAFPTELRPAMIDTIDRLEVPVKEQVSATIYPVYDYLLGKSQSLDLALTLGDTILNPDFAASLVDELDISLLMGGFISEQIAEQVPEELPEELRAALDDAVNDTIIELEPWIKEQAKIAIYPVFDYLLGESQSFTVVISLEPVKESLRDNLKEAFLESLPQLAALPPAFLESLPQLAALPPAFLESLPQLVAALPPALIDQIFNVFYQEFFEPIIPPTFEFNQSLLGTEMPAQIAEALAEGEEALEQARQYVGYFQTGYKALIGFMLLLILGIIFINRQVRNTTRSLGSIFLTFAVPTCLSIAAIKYFDVIQAWILRLLNIDVDIPAQLQALVLQLVNDFVAPIWMLSLGLLAAGVVLLIVSFVYKPRQPSV